MAEATPTALIQCALAALSQPAAFPADLALARARLEEALAQLAPAADGVTLTLHDGAAEDEAEHRALVVPVRLLVDRSGVTVQLPSLLAVTVEHYAGQVRVCYWAPEDSGNDPTYQAALDANLAATAPTD